MRGKTSAHDLFHKHRYLFSFLTEKGGGRFLDMQFKTRIIQSWSIAFMFSMTLWFGTYNTLGKLLLNSLKEHEYSGFFVDMTQRALALFNGLYLGSLLTNRFMKISG
jgi:hypothetical protein